MGKIEIQAKQGQNVKIVSSILDTPFYLIVPSIPVVAPGRPRFYQGLQSTLLEIIQVTLTAATSLPMLIISSVWSLALYWALYLALSQHKDAICTMARKSLFD